MNYYEKNQKWLDENFAIATTLGYFNWKTGEQLTSDKTLDAVINPFTYPWGIPPYKEESKKEKRKVEEAKPVQEPGKGIVSTFSYEKHPWKAEGKIDTKEKNQAGIIVKAFTFTAGFSPEMNEKLTVELGEKSKKGNGWTCAIHDKVLNENGAIDVYVVFRRGNYLAKFEIKERITLRFVLMGRAYPCSGNLHIEANK